MPHARCSSGHGCQQERIPPSPMRLKTDAQDLPTDVPPLLSTFDLEASYFGRLVDRGEDFTVDDAKKYLGKATRDFDSWEATRQQQVAEEAGKKKIKNAQESEARRKTTVMRAAASCPPRSGFAPVVVRSTACRNNPLGGKTRKEEEAALERIRTPDVSSAPAHDTYSSLRHLRDL